MAAHDADLRFDLADPATANVVAQALAPEAMDGPEGTTTALRVEEATLHIHIEAADLSGLRAAITGVVRLLDAAANVAGLAEST